MTGREQCRDLLEWRRIGTITTGNGMFAIVPPYYADTLAKWWERVFLPENDERRAGKRPRLRPQFEEVELRQITTSVTHPEGYEDRESALVFDAPGNGGWDVEARFCDAYGTGHQSICEIRIRLHHYDDEPGEEPQLTPLASRFGTLLGMALREWIDVGRLEGRRVDDVLFNEWDAARDGDFSGFVMLAMYEDWQPGGPKFGEPFPQHRNIQWPLMIVQCAINTRDPELVAAILEAEVRYEGEHPSEWVDEHGDTFVDPEHEASMLGWPSDWRRVFGGQPAG